jgi:hypothetical protein
VGLRLSCQEVGARVSDAFQHLYVGVASDARQGEIAAARCRHAPSLIAPFRVPEHGGIALQIDNRPTNTSRERKHGGPCKCSGLLISAPHLTQSPCNQAFMKINKVNKNSFTN